MTKSKRLKITLVALIANYIVLLVGIYMKSDLAAMGAAIAMINTPLYGYLWGETYRPSKKVETKEKDIQKTE